MTFRVLAVSLLILLVAVAEESKSLPVKRRLCLCGDHAIQVMDDEESSTISCNERCVAVSKDLGGTWSDPRRHILTRRDLSREQQACSETHQSDPRWVIKNAKVTFHDRENDPGSNASSWYAEVSWKPFTDSPDRWIGYCLFYSAGTAKPVKSSFVPENTTSVKIMPSWEKQEVLLSVVALPTFSNSSLNRKEHILMQPYRRGTPATDVDPTKTFTTTKEACSKMYKCDPRWFINSTKVAFHDRENDPGSNASSWYAEVSWKPFTDSPDRWIGYCLFYSAGTGKPVNSSFVPQNTTSVKIMPSWEKRKMLLSMVALPTFSTFILNGKEQKLILLQAYERGPSATDKTFTTSRKGSSRTIAVSISVGTVVGLVLAVCLLVHFLRRKLTGNIPLPLDFKYHAFIIYSSEDQLWMKKKLLPFLEEKHHLTCCVHYRDFVPGAPFRDNMADSVYTSKKVIALFSSNFVNSNYCMHELDIALGRLVERRDDSIIVIRIDKADLKHLPQELKRRSLIDYDDSLERPHWKRKLLAFLGSPEGSRSQSTSDEQSRDIKNGNEYSMDGNGNRARIGFNRLESTTSNVSEISFL